MKLTKEELNIKITESDINDDLKISLLEDINDSFSNDDIIDDLKRQIDEISSERDDIKSKYIERFTNNEIKINENSIKDLDDIKEKNYIDIQSI